MERTLLFSWSKKRKKESGTNEPIYKTDTKSQT